MPDWFARRHIAVGANGIRPEVVTAAAGAGLGLVAAYMVVHGGATRAAGVAALPLVVFLLLRPSRGLAFGLALILALPSWWAFAGRHVYQIGAILAVLSALPPRRVRLKFADYVVAFYMADVVLGWLLQYDQPQTWHIILSYLVPVGYYIGARAIPSSRIFGFMTLTLLAGTVGALTVIYEFIQGHVIFSDPSRYFWNAADGALFRPGGVYGSPPGAATVLSYVFFFGLASLCVLRGRTKQLGVVCLGTCSLALILTFTRGNLIGVGIGLILFLWLLRSPLLHPWRAVPCIVAIATGLLVVLPIVEQNQAFREAIVRPGNLTAREGYWQLALPIATANVHNLVVGVGTGALETERVADRTSLPFSMATTPQVYSDSLHSQYITNLVEQGVIGVVALLLLLLAGFVPAARAARATGDAAYAALAASIVAMAVGSTVITSLLHQPSLIMLLVATGLAATATSDQNVRAGNLRAVRSNDRATV